MINLKLIALGLLSCVVAVLFTGCLVRQKVIRNGEVVREGYVFKRPLKEAWNNSQ